MTTVLIILTIALVASITANKKIAERRDRANPSIAEMTHEQ